MKILITGATGVVGSTLTRRLHAAGHAIRALILPGDPAIDQIKSLVTIVYGDVVQAESIAGLCDGIDVVYHCAAVIIAEEDVCRRINIEGTRSIVSAAHRAGVGHFIHISSASVVYHQSTVYSRSKTDAEMAVKKSGIAYTIVRPTLVYGKGSGGQEFDMFLNYLKKYPVVPFVGTGRAMKSPVFVEDLIDGLVKLCGCPTASGKTYNFSGAEAISMRAFARLCLRLQGTPGKIIVPIPVTFCLILGAVLRLVMKNPPLDWPAIAGITQSANLDPAQAITDIGYKPSGVSQKLGECFPRVIPSRA
jgi:nucleoside-diphosphate-sugar epimerase